MKEKKSGRIDELADDYVIINNNEPEVTDNDLNTESFEYYSWTIVYLFNCISNFFPYLKLHFDHEELKLFKITLNR